MREAAEWMESYREHWEQRFDRLDDYLRESTRKPAPRIRKKQNERHHERAEIPCTPAPDPSSTVRSSSNARSTTTPRWCSAPGWTRHAKARWFNGPPDKWTEEVREMDVRVGGRDRLIGKFVDGSESRFEALYFDVVPERRLVYTYDMYWQGKKISVSLASVEFVLGGQGTSSCVTEQHAFLDGYEDGGSRERGTLAHGQPGRGARRWRYRATRRRR